MYCTRPLGKARVKIKLNHRKVELIKEPNVPERWQVKQQEAEFWIFMIIKTLLKLCV